MTHLSNNALLTFNSIRHFRITTNDFSWSTPFSSNTSSHILNYIFKFVLSMLNYNYLNNSTYNLTNKYIQFVNHSLVNKFAHISYNVPTQYLYIRQYARPVHRFTLFGYIIWYNVLIFDFPRSLLQSGTYNIDFIQHINCYTQFSIFTLSP